ncbi:MAG: DUF4846 domain-containing protein [Crocinitomicaceae bacterium]
MKNRKIKIVALFVLLACTSCGQKQSDKNLKEDQTIANTKLSDNESENKSLKDIIDTSGITLQKRINVPDGFMRTEALETSFTSHLRNLPLKKHGSLVRTHNGQYKANDNVYDAVIDLPIGKRDLHQCADAIMRLRAEWLWKNKRYSEIHFNFTSGWRCDYSEWMKGKRVKLINGKPTWIQSKTASNTPQDLWSYLELIFTYAGTLSLSKELVKIPLSQMEVGDVFIKGGSPGHAVLISDMAVNTSTGEKIFLLMQSYMPAQEIQLLKNNDNPKLSPWYSEKQAAMLSTPEWDFTGNQLMRFK